MIINRRATTIEKITTDKYLYQGRIVDRAFLEARKAEFEQMIVANEQAISAITLIDLIPQIKARPEYVEAAKLYNEKSEEEKVMMEQENIQILNEITELNQIL